MTQHFDPYAAQPLVAGVELGGTKTVALVASGSTILDSVTVPTTEPEVTLKAVARQLSRWSNQHNLAALGIASFGPLNLDPRSRGFGSITNTPKEGWSATNVVDALSGSIAGPVAFDTDVAGAALAEQMWGASIDCPVHVYITVGTGIGGGIISQGRVVHGLLHPELGHVRVRRRFGDDFPGVCPYHGDCLEGLASGPAIAARAGASAEDLPSDHPVWNDVASELAELVATMMLILSPSRIVLGGGVGSGQPHLLPLIRSRAAKLLNSYLSLPAIELDRIVQPPSLGILAGPLGATALARLALNDSRSNGDVASRPGLRDECD